MSVHRVYVNLRSAPCTGCKCVEEDDDDGVCVGVGVGDVVTASPGFCVPVVELLSLAYFYVT